MGEKRAIGILAHVDAGKTTLSEAMLFLSGRLRAQGRVDHGDTFLDTDAIERDRGITIFSKMARFTFGGMEVTLLDTPGHVDFSAETERTLQVLDYAVLVVSGTDGVQGHTRTLFSLLRRYKVPVFFFINKMDLEGADRGRVLRELKEALSENCLDFAVPRAALTEELALCSDALLEEFSETGSISDLSVKKAIAERAVFPVLSGSALKTDGVKELLEALSRYTLGYAERHLGADRADAPFAGRVYKIGRDAAGSRLTYLKVTGGTLRVKDPVTYRSTTEKADQIRLYSGEKYEPAEAVSAGEICAVTGLTGTKMGEGLGAEEGVIRPSLAAVMARSMQLPPDVSAPAFFRKIAVLEEEDPALHLSFNETAKEIRVSVMGEVQIEVLTRVIEERFGQKVTFGPETILYKETILSPVIGIGHFEPLRHYAEVQLLLEPGERGSGITVSSVCSEDVLDLNWQRLILTHVLEREHPGVLTGAPVTDLKVTLLTGRAHLKHTEGGDFREATYRAIRQGLMEASSVLLEPMYRFALDIPADRLGRALSDLSRMRAETEAPDVNGDRAHVEGIVPVSQVGSYVTEVSAYTKGTGSLSLEMAGYAVLKEAEEVISASGYDPLADGQNPSGSVFCAHGAGYLVPWDEVPQHAHCEIPRASLQKVRDVLTAHGLMPTEEEEAAAYTQEARKTRHGGAASGVPESEDAELLSIYRREFGMDRDGVRIDAEKKKDSRPGGRGHGAKGEKYPEIRQKYDKQGNPIYPKKDTRGEYLIVDGYNIIYQWEDLRDLAGASVDAARGKLLDILSNYQGYTGQRLKVVFDAYRADHTPAVVSQYQNIEVVFTKRGETADAYIEREVHEEIKNFRITVATSDGLEQLTVMRLGALRLSAGNLREEIGRVSARGGI